MAEKKIKVKVDVETNAGKSIADLKELKKELKQVAVGSADFKRLSAEIRDVEDAIAGAKLGAEDFAGALEAAPGPVGQLFTALKKVELATKSWGAALKATGIGLIVSLLGGFAAALSKSDETMKKFEPILIMFEQALNGILGALQPLIDGFIELAINVMPYVTKAFKVVYSSVTAVFQSLGKLGGAVVKLFKGDFKGAWEDAKSSVTSFSDNYDAAVDRFEQGQKKMTKTQKENLDKQEKDRDDAAEKAKQQREAELKELMDGQKEAMLELLTEREAEEYKVNEHYSKLLSLATKYGEDTSQLRLAQQNALDEIDAKYKEKEKEKLDKEAEARMKAANDAAKFQYEQYQQIKKLDEERQDFTFKTNQAIGQSWVALGNNIATVFGSLVNVFGQGSDAAKAFGVAQVAINAAASIGSIILNNKQAQAEYNKAIAAGNATIALGISSAFIPGMQGIAAAQIASGKAAVGLATAGKVSSKVNSIAQIATVGVTSAAQIAAILSAGKGSKVSGAGGASAGSSESALPAPALPTVTGASAPQIQTTGGMNPTQQIGETISASQRPIKAYVISGDVTSQQALDRRTSRAATFSAG
jgi:hypothetical protein